jgi:hypothetical protein
MEIQIITLGVTLAGMIGLNVYIHNFFKRITERLDEINGDLLEIQDTIHGLRVNYRNKTEKLLQS